MTGLESSRRQLFEKAKLDRHEGWAFLAVEETFGFLLRDFDYQVGDVHLHQEGSYVSFIGRQSTFIFELEEWWGGIVVVVVVMGSHLNIWDLLSARNPDGKWPAPDRQTRVSKDEAVGMLNGWAGGLKSHAADVF